MNACLPVVSVIMNCRNSSQFLREAIDSVFNQTFTDWEIIFWDNASSDASPDIAQSYAKGEHDRRLRYFRAEEPTPLGAARNLAIAEARGRYIAFLDCDDLWLPEKLADQVALLETNPKVGLACTDTVLFSGRRELNRMFRMAPPKRGFALRELMSSGWIAMSAAMIRKSALDGLGGPDDWFDPDFSMAEEADLFYRLAWNWELDHVDLPLTRWRVHAQNTTFKKFHQFADETRLILDKYTRLHPEFPERYPDLVELLQRRAAFQKAVALWRDGQNRAARAEIAPFPASMKFRLFRLATYLPGACFDVLARAYYALPQFLRK